MTRLGRAAARIRTRASRDEGMTLAEVLVAITILGLSIAGITQALGTASLASADHRKQVNADIVVRAYAEAIKERVRARQDGYVPNVEATDTDGDGDPDTHPYGAAFDAAAFPGYTVSAVPVTEYQDVVDTKNVILILDRSGSIQDLPGTHEDEAGDVRRAAMAFINGLKNTGTHLALVSFSTQATYIPRGNSTTAAWRCTTTTSTTGLPAGSSSGAVPTGRPAWTRPSSFTRCSPASRRPPPPGSCS